MLYKMAYRIVSKFRFHYLTFSLLLTFCTIISLHIFLKTLPAYHMKSRIKDSGVLWTRSWIVVNSQTPEPHSLNCSRSNSKEKEDALEIFLQNEAHLREFQSSLDEEERRLQDLLERTEKTSGSRPKVAIIQYVSFVCSL